MMTRWRSDDEGALAGADVGADALARVLLTDVPQTRELAEGRKPPQLTLQVYEDLVMLTRYHADGRLHQTYPVRARDVRRVLADEVPRRLGPLPASTWDVVSYGGSDVLLLYLAPSRRTLHVAPGEGPGAPLSWEVALPPLLWVAQFTAVVQRHHLFAVRARPAGDGDALYAAPLWNVDPRSGLICFGAVPLPAVEPLHLHQVIDAFFGSLFTPHYPEGKSIAHPTDLAAAWEAARGQRRYPLNDLVRVGTVGGLFGGREGR